MIDPLLPNSTIKTRLLENILEIINSNDEKFLDISIICEDGSFLWSQFLLAAASDLFATAMQGVEVTQVIFPDFHVEDVRGSFLGLLHNTPPTEAEHGNVFIDFLKKINSPDDIKFCIDAEFIKSEIDEVSNSEDLDLNWSKSTNGGVGVAGLSNPQNGEIQLEQPTGKLTNIKVDDDDWNMIELEQEHAKLKHNIQSPILELDQSNKSSLNEEIFEPSTVIRKMKGSSLCWKFLFFKGSAAKGPEMSQVFCKLCTPSVCLSYNSSSSTSNLVDHMKRHHKTEYEKAEKHHKTEYEKTENMHESTKTKMCGTCDACVNRSTTPDCQACIYCLDKKSNGGPGELRKACINRLCTEKMHESIKTKMCGTCDGCVNRSNAQDCDACIYCLDQKRNGGPGKLRKACKKRLCVLMLKTKRKKILLKGKGISRRCNMCDFKTKSKKHLKEHNKSVHAKTIILSCEFDGCKKQYNSDKSLQRHIDAVHKEIRYTCDQCGNTFTEIGSLKKHIKVIHEKISMSNGEKFCCDKCGKEFAAYASLYSHNKVVHELVRYFCDQCDFKATGKSALKVHIDSKHKKITYYCDECEKTYTRKSALRQHKQTTHKGVRYPCDQCDHKATQKGSLVQHIESVHQGVRFNCDQCDHKATQKSSLTQHIEAVHKGVRYYCDQCDYNAIQKCSLQKHMELVHNI